VYCLVGRIKLIVTEKGAGGNTADAGDIITDLSNLEITADGNLVLKVLRLGLVWLGVLLLA
jgi:hypothetical protein